LDFFSQVRYTFLKLLDVVAILLRFMGEEDEALDVLKNLLQDGQ